MCCPRGADRGGRGRPPRCSCGTGRPAAGRSPSPAMSSSSTPGSSVLTEVRLVAVQRLVEQRRRRDCRGVLAERLQRRRAGVRARVRGRPRRVQRPCIEPMIAGAPSSPADVDDRLDELDGPAAHGRVGARERQLVLHPARTRADRRELQPVLARASTRSPIRSRRSAEGGNISTASKPKLRRRRGRRRRRSSQNTNGPPRASGTRLIVTADFMRAPRPSSSRPSIIRQIPRGLAFCSSGGSASSGQFW